MKEIKYLSRRLVAMLAVLAIVASVGTIAYAFHWKSTNHELSTEQPLAPTLHEHRAPPKYYHHNSHEECIRIVKANGTVVKVNANRGMLVLETTLKNRTINVTLKLLPVYVNVNDGAMTYNAWILTHLSEGSRLTVIVAVDRSACKPHGVILALKGYIGIYVSPKGYTKLVNNIS